MNETVRPEDLEPDEREVHAVLASVRPAAPPVGLRDEVMSRLRRERRVTWEWPVAALLALPSLAYLARQADVHGRDFAEALTNVVAAATSDTTDAFFFVDGLTVLAVALFGLACALAAHALLATGRREVAR